MIAEAGGIRKVNGSRIATPFAPPSPGSTPMIVPRTMPIPAMARLYGVIATVKPRAICSKPISVAQPRLEGSLRQRHQEPSLEDEEGQHDEDEREHDGEDQGVPPRPPHVEAHVERGGDVQAQAPGEQD